MDDETAGRQPPPRKRVGEGTRWGSGPPSSATGNDPTGEGDRLIRGYCQVRLLGCLPRGPRPTGRAPGFTPGRGWVRVPRPVSMLRWRNGTTHLALNQENAGSNPARSTLGAVGKVGERHLPHKQAMRGFDSRPRYHVKIIPVSSNRQDA